jgi:hypothetical protein
VVVVGRSSNSLVNAARKKFGYYECSLRRFTSFKAFCDRVKENKMLGALPASLGLITLSTATKTLQQRNKDVYEALLKVGRDIDESEAARVEKFDRDSVEWKKMVAEQEELLKKLKGQK